MLHIYYVYIKIVLLIMDGFSSSKLLLSQALDIFGICNGGAGALVAWA